MYRSAPYLPVFTRRRAMRAMRAMRGRRVRRVDLVVARWDDSIGTVRAIWRAEIIF